MKTGGCAWLVVLAALRATGGGSKLDDRAQTRTQQRSWLLGEDWQEEAAQEGLHSLETYFEMRDAATQPLRSSWAESKLGMPEANCCELVEGAGRGGVRFSFPGPAQK